MHEAVRVLPVAIRILSSDPIKQGFVSRVESEDDRRVRIVSLTEKGREMFVSLFRQQTALDQQAFQDVSPKEQKQVEDVLKRIGKRADRLASEKNT
jgi:MarR family transcriptional regulator, 2-MHQ and catechol-resistance regulon repressor